MDYRVILRDETGCEFCIEASGSSADDVWLKTMHNYPESHVQEVMSLQAVNQDAAERFDRLAWELDNDMDWS